MRKITSRFISKYQDYEDVFWDAMGWNEMWDHFSNLGSTQGTPTLLSGERDEHLKRPCFGSSAIELPSRSRSKLLALEQNSSKLDV